LLESRHTSRNNVLLPARCVGSHPSAILNPRIDACGPLVEAGFFDHIEKQDEHK
jgi:hypothetical protein